MVPLTDAQGSVIALADSSGNLLTRYYYDPFGNTVAGGLSSSNEFQYIGRENDFNGLYYMHARYYSPAIGRFISEDPLGFGGGDVNLHGYTLESPTNLRDPNGTNPLLVGCALGATTDVALNLWADYVTGRKSRWQDAFSWATLRYAATGCVAGATFAFGAMTASLYAEALFPIGPGAILSQEMAAAASGGMGGEAGAGSSLDLGEGTIFSHFTDSQGMQGVTGLDGLAPGESTAVGELTRRE